MTLRYALALTSALALVGAAQAEDIPWKPFKTVYETLPAAKKGGTVVMRINSNPKVMNPLLSNDSNSSAVEGYLWGSLLDTDPETRELFPSMAANYWVSADRKTYTFELRPGILWDNGQPVTAEDYEFSYNKIMDEKIGDTAELRSYWEGVKFKKLSATKIQFSIDTPKFNTLRFIGGFPVIQKKEFEGKEFQAKMPEALKPVGNGPYILEKFDQNVEVVFKRNPKWWGYKLPQYANLYNADKVVLKIIESTPTAYEKFLNGEIDLRSFNEDEWTNKVNGNDKPKFGESQKDGKSVWSSKIENKAARGFDYIGWNNAKAPFNSVKFRTAMSYTVDYKQIIDNVYYGLRQQASSPFGSLTKYSDANLRKPGTLITTDTKKALALLKEDGWSDSDKDGILDKMVDGKKMDLKFSIKTNANNPLRVKIVNILKENFKRVGADVEIKTMEWNAFLDDVDKKDFDAMVLAWTGTSEPDPYQIWHSTQIKEGSNSVSYSNKTVDDLIEKAKVEFDTDKRAELLKEINRILYAEQPYTFLTEPKFSLQGFNKKVNSKVWSFAYSGGAMDEVYSYVP